MSSTRRDVLSSAGAAALLARASSASAARGQGTASARPNILFILMDNLGFGEPGVYGGGALRGAPTPRIDGLATEGLRLTNFNVEAQCTPSRSAMLTGRFSIRSGTHSVPLPGQLDGLTQWEITLAETLSGAGYATGAFGKWHLGSSQARLPNAQGFDEWFGIPRTTDESMFPSQPGAQAEGIPFMHMMEGRKGEQSRELGIYDLDARRAIDSEIVRRTADFMRRSASAGKPFYAYVPFTLVHVPALPNAEFAGRTGFGDFADCLAEMDANVGQLLDVIDELGARDDTIVVFTSDNGPDSTFPSQGTSGPWRGYYFTHMEGSLRTPFIVRWPGKVAAGRVSDEIFHSVDTFTTFAAIAGADLPQDRAIDGVDQRQFLLGQSARSARDGFPVFVADRMEAVKWKHWKMAFYEQESDWWSPPIKMGVPKIFDLISDPKEEYGATLTANGWVGGPMMRIVSQFEDSLKRYPPISPGTPDPYRPPRPA